MNLFRLVCLFCLLFTSFISLAQDKEDVIQHIRDRYYRINGGGLDLEEYEVEELKVTEENGQIVIIKEPTPDGVFEYYFDGAFKSKRPYFIYFASKDNAVKPDLRVYLDSRGEAVWYKENDKDIELETYRGPYHLTLRAVNAYNTIKYKGKFNDPKANSLLDYVEEVHDMVLVKNTVDYQSYPDEGNYSEWDIAYHKFRGRTVLTQKGQGGEHGSSQEIAYLKEGEKVLTITENSGWIGFRDNITFTIEYFDNGKLFRKEMYRSYGESISKPADKKEFDLCWFDRSKMVPEVIVH